LNIIQIKSSFTKQSGETYFKHSKKPKLSRVVSLAIKSVTEDLFAVYILNLLLYLPYYAELFNESKKEPIFAI